MIVKGYKKNQLYFEDIIDNGDIPPITKPTLTTSNMAAFGGASGMFCAMHFDYGAARNYYHLSEPAAFGSQISQFMAQLMTDWIGPNSMLKKMSSYLKRTVTPGMQITVKGKVVRKYSKDDEHFVDCNIWAEDQDGNVVNEGTATASIPSRNA